ncbi:MAG: protein translocase subunit SecD, partial [Candidatus Babeliales bacterium]
DVIILPGKDRDELGNRRYYLLPAFTDINGSLLKDARAGFGGQSGAQLVVNFEFMPEGGERFYELTRKSQGQQIAIVLDDKVISAPVVNEPIGSRGQITGRFTSEEVNELAALLKSGAFVAPVTFEEERRIGPALGAESIRQGLMSCLIGLGFLLAFSLFYYKIAGLFAFIALLFNLLLILFILSRFHATLTLPGIAGMVLTVGMAIDASILIYERIREELRAGIHFDQALKVGFSDAMVVILDANITTFIVGVVLFKFGTGPIQGYAVTLLVGIISTLITGLFFLRSLFNVTLDGFGFKNVKM